MTSGLSVASSSATPTLQTTTSAAHPTSPRSSGFRSLNYLRTYSNHISDRVASGRVAADPDVPRLSRDRYTLNNNPSSSSRRPLGRSSTIGFSDSTSTADSSSIRARLAARRNRNAATGVTQPATAGWLPSVSNPAASPDSSARPSPFERHPEEVAPFDGPAVMPRLRSITNPGNTTTSTSSSSSYVPHPGHSSGLNVAWNHQSQRPTTDISSSTSASMLPGVQLPSIRFVPYQDPRSPRPSLNFSTTTRILPNSNSIIRVGRYSEKDTLPPSGSADIISDAPIGFKSKVVSRRHCEFYYQDNHWYIKDVKSSSGTFLNHIRLSPPGEESRPYAVKDGDIVQLGIDFKGGEEMIFRCVKIRILCNRGWATGPNKFNKSAHKHLNDLQKGTAKSGDDTSGGSTECTICLNPIAPCQSLFVAPCSHTWHYKCIRPMLDGVRRALTSSNEAHFSCPNCRNVADLNADVEPVVWEDSDEHDSDAGFEILNRDADSTQSNDPSATAVDGTEAHNLASRISDLSFQDAVGLSPARSGSSTPKALNPGASDFVPSRSNTGSLSNGRSSSSDEQRSSDTTNTLTDSLDALNPMSVPRNGTPSNVFASDVDGPLTPRNNAGPFVFDGAASGRVGSAG